MYKYIRAVLPLCLASGAWADLLTNGNFESGNTGFTTDYTLVATNGTISTQPGQYGIVSDPSTAFLNGYTSFGDHTTGSGLLMLVDGNTGNVWSETVSVTPSTLYTFTGWVASASTQNLASLALFVDGSQAGSDFGAPSTVGNWTKWTQTFTTGSSTTSIALSIQDVNGQPLTFGNDFALDDLSLNGPAISGVPEPGYLPMLLPAVVWMVRRHIRR